MNPLIQLKKTAPVFLVALVYFGLLPTTQAVVPAPDGGYPGGNTAEGQSAILSLTTGGYNTAIGYFSLRGNSTGGFNTALGAGTLLANTADGNTASGAGALLSNSTGSNNTANGALALFSNTTGVVNTANGDQALFHNTTGSNNTAIGYQALSSSTTNNNNTAVGSGALTLSTTGGGNIALGNEAGLLVTTASDVICIGSAGANVDGTCFIGSIRGVTTQHNDAMPVVIDSNSQLGTVSSSRRYKTDIKPMDKASESILALKPVGFRYKVHEDTTPQYGLIAEEVAEVNPDLVIYDADGKPYTVRYEAVNAMLLNEFLKEHNTVQELKSTVVKQQATIAEQRKDFEANTAQQQKEIQTVTASLKEQAAQIQKVSAQLEASKPAPQVVNNP